MLKRKQKKKKRQQNWQQKKRKKKKQDRASQIYLKKLKCQVRERLSSNLNYQNQKKMKMIYKSIKLKMKLKN